MASMVNVNREVTDQLYRYKMPKILAKVSVYLLILFQLSWLLLAAHIAIAATATAAVAAVVVCFHAAAINELLLNINVLGEGNVTL